MPKGMPMQDDSRGDNPSCGSVCTQEMQQEKSQKSWKGRKGMKTTGKIPGSLEAAE